MGQKADIGTGWPKRSLLAFFVLWNTRSNRNPEAIRPVAVCCDLCPSAVIRAGLPDNLCESQNIGEDIRKRNPGTLIQFLSRYSPTKIDSFITKIGIFSWSSGQLLRWPILYYLRKEIYMKPLRLSDIGFYRWGYIFIGSLLWWGIGDKSIWIQLHKI